MAEPDGFQRLTGTALFENITPCHDKAAIGGLKRRNLNTMRPQNIRPAAIGSQLGPRGPAERQNGGISLKSFLVMA